MYRLVFSADFGGQELSVMAAGSGDPIMCEALNTGSDLHSQTAVGLYGESHGVTLETARDPIPGLNGVTFRDRGKVWKFSSVYGKTVEGFAKMWNLPVEFVKKMQEGYRKRFPVLCAWIDAGGDQAELQQFSTLPNGAMRFVGGEGESAGARSSRRRQGGNYLVQGYSAVMTKIAIVNLDTRARNENLNLWASVPVHDELVGELEYHPECASGLFWADYDPKGVELKAAVAAAKAAKDKEAEGVAKKALSAYEAHVNDCCKAKCGPTDCAYHLKQVVGEVMVYAGDAILQGIVPATFDCKVARHWEH